MKRLIYLVVLLPILLWGQDSNQNFVKSIQYRDTNSGNPKVTVDYFDGLGRISQRIENKQSGAGKDLVTHYGYEDGRLCCLNVRGMRQFRIKFIPREVCNLK